MSKQDKYTRSARDQQCQVRIPYYCQHDSSTVIFAHLNGGGTGMKRLSIHGSYCCSICHDIVDHRKPIKDFSPDEIKQMHLDGMVRTQEIMVRDGVLKL